MRKISTALPSSQRVSKVANFVHQRLNEVQDRTGKTVGEIADEIGLPQRNMLSMIRSGVTKLPFDRIRSMAYALEVSVPELLELALEEYQPHLRDVLHEVYGRFPTRNELLVLQLWRAATGERDPSLEPYAMKFTLFVQETFDMQAE